MTFSSRYGLLLAAFGSSSSQGESTLRAFEVLVRERYPTASVRWAFTSTAMRARLAEARKKADSVDKALRKMAFERFTHVAVQPLHVIAGLEYADVQHDVSRLLAEGLFTDVQVGCPLLDVECRFDALERVCEAMIASIPVERAVHEAVLFMGHGSRHVAESGYVELGRTVQARDPLVFVGTINGSVRLEHLLPQLHERGVRQVWLLPLLAVVGNHALQDMAGQGEGSWRSQLEAAGFVCTPLLRGMVEQEAFARLWVDCLQLAVQRLMPL